MKQGSAREVKSLEPCAAPKIVCASVPPSRVREATFQGCFAFLRVAKKDLGRLVLFSEKSRLGLTSRQNLFLFSRQNLLTQSRPDRRQQRQSLWDDKSRWRELPRCRLRHGVRANGHRVAANAAKNLRYLPLATDMLRMRGRSLDGKRVPLASTGSDLRHSDHPMRGCSPRSHAARRSMRRCTPETRVASWASRHPLVLRRFGRRVLPSIARTIVGPALAVLAKLDSGFGTERRIAAFGSAAARLMRAYAPSCRC
jgi:hypothetical protein